jgi:hypothetical protein
MYIGTLERILVDIGSPVEVSVTASVQVQVVVDVDVTLRVTASVKASAIETVTEVTVEAVVMVGSSDILQVSSVPGNCAVSTLSR